MSTAFVWSMGPPITAMYLVSCWPLCDWSPMASGIWPPSTAICSMRVILMPCPANPADAVFGDANVAASFEKPYAGISATDTLDPLSGSSRPVRDSLKPGGGVIATDVPGICTIWALAGSTSPRPHSAARSRAADEARDFMAEARFARIGATLSGNRPGSHGRTGRPRPQREWAFTTQSAVCGAALGRSLALMAEPASDLQWKSRYRELVRDFETKEREWAELETALRAAASRVAVAAMGQSDELDHALGPLVESLRTKGALPHLDTSTTSLVRALKVHESTAQKQTLPDLPKLLAGLVRALGRVPGFGAAEMALSDRLAAGIAPGGWGELLEDLARDVGAVVERLRSQRNELEDFLEQITHQLALLEAWTSWQTGAAQSRVNDTDGLERDVAAEMSRLLRDVDESPDIGALKSKVQTRLDTVTKQLHDFRKNEERRSAESEARSTALQQEVGRLKTRTHDLAELCASQERQLLLDPLTGTHSRYAYERR